jgi:hypothetical protein
MAIYYCMFVCVYMCLCVCAPRTGNNHRKQKPDEPVYFYYLLVYNLIEFLFVNYGESTGR